LLGNYFDYREFVQKIPTHLRGILRKIINALIQKFGDRLYSVVLYGSIARGDWKPDSDIDLLIIIDDLPKSRLERQRIFSEVEKVVMKDIESLWEKGYYHDFSPILKTPDEARRFSPLYLDFIEDSIILFDRNSFFGEILTKLRDKLMRLGARKIRIGKKWVWDLKPDYKWGDVIQIE